MRYVLPSYVAACKMYGLQKVIRQLKMIKHAKYSAKKHLSNHIGLKRVNYNVSVQMCIKGVNSIFVLILGKCNVTSSI